MKNKTELNPDVIFKREGRQLQENDICQLEKEIGFSLPTEYRSFLLAYNAAIFSPTPNIKKGKFPSLCFDAPYDLEDKKFTFILGNFEALTDSQEHFGIRESYKNKLGWGYPKDLLPFAHDPGNMTILIGLSPPHLGKIYVAGSRYLAKYNDSEQRSNITVSDFWEIAPSFESFIKNLYWEDFDTQ
jgi:hypothetical protein